MGLSLTDSVETIAIMDIESMSAGLQLPDHDLATLEKRHAGRSSPCSIDENFVMSLVRGKSISNYVKSCLRLPSALQANDSPSCTDA